MWAILAGAFGGYFSLFNRFGAAERGVGTSLSAYVGGSNFRGGLAFTTFRYTPITTTLMPRFGGSGGTAVPGFMSQFDATFSYLFRTSAGIFSAGGHYVLTEDTLSAGALALFGGYGLYRSDHSLEAGAALSLYPNFRVFQILLSASERLVGDLWLSLNMLHIRLVENTSNLTDLPTNMTSFGGGLAYYRYPYDAYVSGWIGQRMFAVWNYGFVVYNFADLYSGEVFMGAGYSIGRVRYGLDLTFGRFRDLVGGTDALHAVLTLSLLYR
ncbi:MAG: hypothetical protein GXO29_03200 [Thermotogae bacterium]|nr:hypothetical protein [Thermotogota bacterium]